MEYRTLGKAGWRVSALSFGASSLGSEFRPIDESEGIRAVHVALDNGVNFLDVSPYYGRTTAETVLGKALKTVSRDRYLLATKVGRYDKASFDFSAARVTASMDESLGRLGVDYVDLIQCHDIEFGSLDQIVSDTLPALRRLQDAGKVRAVGITGLPLPIFRTVLDRADVDTILSYCRYSLNDTALEDELPYLQSKGVGVITASPLAMRLLSLAGPPGWHPAPDSVKKACARAAAHCATKGADIEKLAVQFSLRNPAIHTVVVGTANPENMRRNIAWADEPTDETLLEEVLAILAPAKNVTWLSGRSENNA